MRANPIDEPFLIRFAHEHWERKPLVLRNIKSDLIELDDKEVFKLVVKAADRSRRERRLLGFKFYVHGVRSSDVETLFVLPRKGDKTLRGYNERMERMYHDYCLVCDELLQVNGDKQELLARFTRQLFRHVGFPNRFAEMGLYLGNYRKTPFGVHRDPCGVFSFPVIGTKTFRVWTPKYLRQNPSLEHSSRYSKHKSSSRVLSASAGDMIYWPSSSWHIAESDGSFSATWSLGVWIDRPTREIVSETVMNLLTRKIGDSLSSGVISKIEKSEPETSNGEVRRIPDAFQEAITALKSLSRAELETAFREAWMKRFAQSGLKTQAKRDDAFRLKKVIRLRDRQILWTLDESSSGAKLKFLFAYGDSGTLVSTSKSLLRLIKDVNGGKACNLMDYLGKKNRAQDLRAIRALGSAGAFQ